MDALPHIYEVNAEKDKKHPGVDRYPDEPRNPDVIDKDHFDYLKHTKTRDQPETIQLVYQWRELLDNYKTKHGGETRAIMTEACDVSVDILKQYFGDSKSNRKGAQIPFNFQLIEHINAESTAHDYVACINNFLRVVPEGHPPNWVVSTIEPWFIHLANFYISSLLQSIIHFLDGKPRPQSSRYTLGR